MNSYYEEFEDDLEDDDIDFDDDVEFYSSLYDYGDSASKIYSEYEENENELLMEIAKIMLIYIIADSKMQLKNTENKKLKNDLFKLIQKSSKRFSQTTIDCIRDIVGNVINKVWDHYSYDYIEKDTKKLVNEKFKGKSFDERVKKHIKEMVAMLYRILMDFLNGDIDVNDIQYEIKKVFNQSKSNIKRLIETEISRGIYKAFKVKCEKSDIKKVLYCATLERSCEECLFDHGTIFNIDDAPELPRHPYCKCYYIPLY